MNKRLIKEECYLDMLEDEINSVEAVINHIKKIKHKEGIFEEIVLQKDIIRAQFNLELALASLCILLRKMAENVFIYIDEEIKKDLNSIIHSNKFEFKENKLYVYSQKRKELVNLNKLLQFAHSIL